MKKFMMHLTMLCVLAGLSASVQAVTLAEAIDMPGATITTSGYGWEVTTDRAQTGGYCARSKNYHVNSSTASMTLTVTGPGRISFRWMSSGEGHNYDYLWYCVDGGSELRRIQGDHGDSSWETVTYDISDAGTHTITWTYRKDGSADYGSDRGYVDCVSWTPAPASVTVTFNYQDGETESTTQSYATGRAFGTLPTPVRAGYTFGGWYMEPSCVTRVNATDDSFIANTTVYAKWTAKEYTVVFHREGGTSLTVTRTGFLIDVAANLPDLTEDLDWGSAATFTGWAKTRGAAVATYGNGAEVKNLTTTNGGTVELYAVWR